MREIKIKRVITPPFSIRNKNDKEACLEYQLIVVSPRRKKKNYSLFFFSSKDQFKNSFPYDYYYYQGACKETTEIHVGDERRLFCCLNDDVVDIIIKFTIELLSISLLFQEKPASQPLYLQHVNYTL